MIELSQEQLLALHEKAKLIELKPVISSNIGGMGYDPENKLLKVAFKTKTGSSVKYMIAYIKLKVLVKN